MSEYFCCVFEKKSIEISIFYVFFIVILGVLKNSYINWVFILERYIYNFYVNIYFLYVEFIVVWGIFGYGKFWIDVKIEGFW